MMRYGCLEREKKKQGRGNDFFHFSDQYFLVFYVNIQPFCSKTRMGYFNIKIRRDRLNGENYQRVSA